MTPTGCAFQTSTHSYCRRRASGCKSKPWEPNSGQKVKGPQGTWLTNFSWPPSQTNVYIRNGTLTSMVSSLGVRYSKAFIDIYTQDTYSITFRNTLCGLISPPLHCPLTSEKVEIQARMQTHLHGGRLGSFPSGLGGSVSYSAWPGQTRLAGWGWASRGDYSVRRELRDVQTIMSQAHQRLSALSTLGNGLKATRWKSRKIPPKRLACFEKWYFSVKTTKEEKYPTLDMQH